MGTQDPSSDVGMLQPKCRSGVKQGRLASPLLFISLYDQLGWSSASVFFTANHDPVFARPLIAIVTLANTTCNFLWFR